MRNPGAERRRRAMDPRAGATTHQREQTDWHCREVAEVARLVETDLASGLSTAVAQHRRATAGPNRLVETKARPPWLKFFDQFRNLLVLVLIGAALLAWLIGEFKDAVVILSVVVLNALLGFHQEYRAERTLSTLKAMVATRSRVRRDGMVIEIDADDLVPGDLVLLEAGERVPADGRLIIGPNLEVDEAALTGESHAVGKSPSTLSVPRAPLAERLNLLYMNTVVTRGRAEMIVVATGMTTEMGRLAGLIAETRETETPLQRQLDTLGKRLSVIAGVIVILIFMLDLARGLAWTQAAITAVALAVAAIPEGLPAVVTVTLAIGMWRMAQNRAILKKLVAVETLGSTTVICSDKTGTLTLNQMTARAGWFAGQRFSVTGTGYDRAGEIRSVDVHSLTELARPLALCNDSCVRDGRLLGDPTEGALWVLAEKAGFDPESEQSHRPRLAEIPFDSAHKFMATFHHAADQVELYVKGAPDVLLDRSTHWLTDRGSEVLSEAMRTRIQDENEFLANQSLRVLAVARRTIPAAQFDPGGDLWSWTEGLTFVGLAGLMDPPRPEAAAAIARCAHAGIQVKMITGDHRLTAAAIGRELGLQGDVVTGVELDAMDDATLMRRIDAISVIARVSPEHKVRIVKSLQARGHIVAMTGDGINDAPAIKTADIGVAMGVSGTAVTREAATMVLTDDNFATIVRAVEEGRVIFDNIVKFVRFQLSTNIGAILTVLAATLMGLPAPFTAIQLLWINIIMDGPPAMTLGVEPARPGIMQAQPRRPEAQILTLPRLARLAFYGVTMMVGTIWLFQLALTTHGETYALTLAFTTFVLFQFFNVFNARNEQGTAFNNQFFANGKLWLALASVLALQWLVVTWPSAQEIFATTALQPAHWLAATLMAASVLLLEETRKWLQRRTLSANPGASVAV